MNTRKIKQTVYELIRIDTHMKCTAREKKAMINKFKRDLLF